MHALLRMTTMWGLEHLGIQSQCPLPAVGTGHFSPQPIVKLVRLVWKKTQFGRSTKARTGERPLPERAHGVIRMLNGAIRLRDIRAQNVRFLHSQRQHQMAFSMVLP
jgi:hypothetical protein